VNQGGDLTEFIFVCAGMVCAEQEFSATAQLSANVCLSTTAIATIGRIERWRLFSTCRHGLTSSHIGTLV
jgi:hypothetical protein